MPGSQCRPRGRRQWQDTPSDRVDVHVEDEWSLAQTLRHLILATDAWLRGGILREEQPFHEIGQIFTGAAEFGFDMSIFRADLPSYDEILAVRAERQQLVTDFLATATPELLAEQRDDPWGRRLASQRRRLHPRDRGGGVGAPALHPTRSRPSGLSHPSSQRPNGPRAVVS